VTLGSRVERASIAQTNCAHVWRGRINDNQNPHRKIAGSSTKHRCKTDKKLADSKKLLHWWSAWHREERDAALAAYGTTLGELFRAFANIECVQPAQLIGFIAAIDWEAIDFDTRLTVLHEVNEAITKYREKRGLELIDDPLPGAPPNAFRVIRKILTTEFPATTRGRPVGGIRQTVEE
jgi:hypothetical protein